MFRNIKRLGGLCWTLLAFSVVPPSAISGDGGIADPEFTETIKTTSEYIHNQLDTIFGPDPTLHPAVSIALVHDERIVWSDAFGHADLENQIPATPETVYLLASVSKTFAAVLALQLHDQGALDLDAPLTDYLPEFQMRRRFPGVKARITPRRLLNHHSGIPQEVESTRFFARRPWSGYGEFLLNYLRNDYPSQYPGEVGVYNNVGFDLSAIMVARITGKNYADLARESLFQPLGMDSTAFGGVYRNMAKGYDPVVGELAPYSPGYGSDGANSNVIDLAQFLLMILGEGEHPNGTRVLDPETVSKVMTIPEISLLDRLQPSLRFGLGWDNVADPNLQYAGAALVKGGNDTGYNAQIGVMPDWKLGVAVLCNHDSIATLPNTTMVKCLQAAIQELGGPEPAPPELPEIQTETDVDEISGYYCHFSAVDRITAIDDQTLKYEKNILGENPVSSTLSLVDGTHYVDNTGSSTIKFYFKDVEAKDGKHFVMVMEMSPHMVIHREKFDPAPIPEVWRRRAGKIYLPDTFLHDSLTSDIYPFKLEVAEMGETETLALSGVPLSPRAAASLAPQPLVGVAFVAGAVVNRGDSCVRISGRGRSERLLYNGDSYLDTGRLPKATLDNGCAFQLEPNTLRWHELIVPEVGTYLLNFPLNARLIIFDQELLDATSWKMKVPLLDADGPRMWDCPRGGTYYAGLVVSRPTRAFIEIKQPYPIQIKAVATPGGDISLPDAPRRAGEPVELKATAADSHVFLRWEMTAGHGVLDDPHSPLTNLTALANATVKAVFAKAVDTVSLTLINDGAGECAPLETIRIKKTRPFTIKASPDDGFVFIEWRTRTGDPAVANKRAARTEVTASADSVLEAVFRGISIVRRNRAHAKTNLGGTDELTGEVTARGIPLAPEMLNDFSLSKVQGVSFGGHYFDFQACDAQTAVPVTGQPMKSFAIGSLTLATADGETSGGRLRIGNSTFEIGETFPEKEPIVISVGRLVFQLPSVTEDDDKWSRRGDAHSFRAKHFHGGRARAQFNARKGIWNFQLTATNLDGVDFASNPVVRLVIGRREGAVAIRSER